MIINMTSGGVMPDRILDAQAIVPGTEERIIEEGAYLRGPLTIYGDKNLTPDQLPKDVNLFGVQGTRPPEYGVNVWERGNLIPARAYTISFSCIQSSPPAKVQCSTTGIAVNELTPALLVGKTLATYGGGTMSLSFLNETQIAYVTPNGTTTHRYTLDSATGVLTVNGVDIGGGWTLSTISGTIAEEWEPQDFIVNDNISAFPDNDYGVGGYFYKLLASIASANVMRLSNNALDTVQQDYRDQIETEVSNA